MTSDLWTAGAASEAATDVTDVVLLHRAVRRGFDELPGLLRTVGPGERERVRPLADRVDAIVELFYLHQASEQDLLWPRLKDRAPTRATQLSRYDQEAESDQNTEEVRRLTTQWRAEGKIEYRDELASAIEKVRYWVGEQLDRDEAVVLPLASKVVRQAEWDLMAETRVSAVANGKAYLHIGAALEGASSLEKAKALRRFPLDARASWFFRGRRAYKRHLRKIGSG